MTAARAQLEGDHDAEADDGRATPGRDLAQAVVSGTRWLAAARALTEVMLLTVMVALARLIPPAEYGRFAIVLFTQELAMGVVGGFGNALVQRDAMRREHLQAGFAIVLAAQAAIVLVTVLALAPLVFAPLFGSETAGLIRLAAPGWLIATVATVPQALLLRRLDFRRTAQIQMVSLLAGAGFSLALAAFAGLDAEALVLGGIGASIVATVVSLACAPVPPPRFERDAARDLMAFGLPASIATISWAGFRNADYAIVGARLGAASAGIYWRAFQLAVEYQKKVSVIMTQMAFPVMSRTTSVHEMFMLRRRMVRLLTVAIFPLLAGLVALAPVVVPWVFGPAWAAAVVPTQILAVAGGATLVIDAVGATLMAAGRARALLGYGWAHFIAYAGTILAVASRGLVAVSLAAVGVHLVFLGVAYGVLTRGRAEGPVRALIADIGPASASTVAFLAVALPLASALRAHGVTPALQVLCVGLPAMVAYLLVLRVAFAATWHDAAALGRRLLPARLSRGSVESGRRRVAPAASQS